jgi:ribosomal protein L7/L12
MLRSGPHNIEDVLKLLRRNDYSKIESIKVLVDIGGQSLADAKEAVHNSRAWRDTADEDAKFHDSILNALEGPRSDNQEEEKGTQLFS